MQALVQPRHAVNLRTYMYQGFLPNAYDTNAVLVSAGMQCMSIYYRMSVRRQESPIQVNDLTTSWRHLADVCGGAKTGRRFKCF
jgi:hypothetical protein